MSEPNDPIDSGKLDKVTDATFKWSEFFSTPAGKVIGVMVMTLVAMLSSWLTDKLQPKPAPIPAPQPPAIINVVPGGDQQPPAPPIIVPSAPVYKVVLHLTASAKAIPSSDLLKGMLLQVDPKIYPDGSAYPFNGKNVPLPCMAQHADGKVVDVQPFTKAEEVAAFVKKVMP